MSFERSNIRNTGASGFVDMDKITCAFLRCSNISSSLAQIVLQSSKINLHHHFIYLINKISDTDRPFAYNVAEELAITDMEK